VGSLAASGGEESLAGGPILGKTKKEISQMMDDIIWERCLDHPEIVSMIAMKGLEKNMQNSHVPGMGMVAGGGQSPIGMFADLISLKWRVNGLSMSINPISQEEEYSVTLVDAAANESGHFWNQRSFRITQDEYEYLDLGDMVSITLNIEQGSDGSSL
jgi:hypothetical protein